MVVILEHNRHDFLQTYFHGIAWILIWFAIHYHYNCQRALKILKYHWGYHTPPHPRRTQVSLTLPNPTPSVTCSSIIDVTTPHPIHDVPKYSIIDVTTPHPICDVLKYHWRYHTPPHPWRTQVSLTLPVLKCTYFCGTVTSPLAKTSKTFCSASVSCEHQVLLKPQQHWPWLFPEQFCGETTMATIDVFGYLGFQAGDTSWMLVGTQTSWESILCLSELVEENTSNLVGGWATPLKNISQLGWLATQY